MKTSILTAFVGLLLLSCNEGGPTQTAIFPKGNKAPASNFTGNVYLQPLVADDSTFHLVMGSVTFEPGARSNWHNHPAGQILLITDGVCYTQERGKPLQTYRKGDVVKCLSNVDHWHGASPDTSMTHISVNPNTEKGVVNWLEPVTDSQYNGAQKR